MTKAQVLRWCDEHFERTGSWPKANCGLIPNADGDTWQAVDMALRKGRRGLRKTSLHLLLAKYRHVERMQLPALTTRQILAWCDEHHERTGRWPTSESGRV